MRKFWLAIPVFTLALAAAALAAQAEREDPTPLPSVHVRLASLGSPDRIIVRADHAAVTSTATGEPMTVVDGPLVLTVASGAEVGLGEQHAPSLKVEAETLTVQVGRVTRVYPGALIVSRTSAGLSLTNECPLESYTEGVLARECPSLFRPEAIKAMAVAARSYSYRKAFLGRNDLCDTTHCQVYAGIGDVKPSIRKAVEETAGLCALYDNDVIDAVYCSDCGGHTEANEDAFKGAHPLPYLRPVEDAPAPNGQPFCAVNRSHNWSLLLPASRLKSLLGKPAESIKVALTNLTQSGRVRELRLVPEAPTATDAESQPESLPAKLAKVFTGDQWRRMLGLSAVKSLRFEARECEKGIELVGQGWGHGVGLCQFGAEGMARQGASFDEILKHYYTGVSIAPAPDVTAEQRITQRRGGVRRASAAASRPRP